MATAMLLAIAVATPSARAEDVTKSFTVNGRAIVRVDTNDGSVRVTSGDNKEVQFHVEYQGYELNRSLRVDTRQDGDKVELVARASGHQDPQFIVVDEVAAQWLVLVAAPLDWRAYLAAFLLFRVFDIMKPWPARAIERRVAGGLGIMLDDVAAALYAILLLMIGEGVFGVRP